MEALGTLDESTAFLGIARARVESDFVREVILQIQQDLIGMMSEIAADPANAERFQSITENNIIWLETQANAISLVVQQPTTFVIPGEYIGSASLSAARTIIRRAERRVTELLFASEICNKYLIAYLNRLSSLLFVMELMEIQRIDLQTKHKSKLASGE
jgi:cob(I)alamin adenosyltransferase